MQIPSPLAPFQAADSLRSEAEAPAAQEAIADSASAFLEAMAEEKKSQADQAAEAVSGIFSGVVDGLHSATGFSNEVIERLLLTGLAIIVLWALRLLVLRLVFRRVRDVRARYQWRKSSSYVTVVFGAFVLLRIWLEGLGSLATFFGLLSAGLAISLKDPLVNLAGWLFILWRRPFAPGDRVTIRERTGDIIDQRVFMFTLLEVGTETGAGQSTGRLIHVPNGWVFTEATINFTRGFPYIWNEIAVLVTFESDWRGAKRMLLGIIQEHGEALSQDAERKLRRAAQDYLIFYSKLTPTVYTTVRDSGIELTMRYLVEPRRRRGSEQEIWEAILDAFAADETIDFAYPTMRYYYNATEGKPGARADLSHGDGQVPGLVQPTPPPIEPPAP